MFQVHIKTIKSHDRLLDPLNLITKRLRFEALGVSDPMQKISIRILRWSTKFGKNKSKRDFIFR